jgi:tRNA(Ile)-lysidine synthase
MLDRLTLERAVRAAAGGPIAVALSGGGDSVALLHLLQEALGAERLIALIVDHALRAGSADDARAARGFAAKLGVRAEILTLDWGGAPKRAQRTTRRARYAALCGAARCSSARVIAVAHSADDQAETVMMRAAGGSSWRGLASMAALSPPPVWPEGRGLWLARPLLGQRRAALRAALQARGADWIEDPANADTAFERVRVRARLAALERGGFDPMRLSTLAARLRIRADALDAAALALIDAAARFAADAISLPRSAWCGEQEVRRRALSALIAAAAGAEREPAAPALAKLEEEISADNFAGGSLGGAVVRATPLGIAIRRDVGALLGRADGAAPLPPLTLPAGVEIVWDGRLLALAHAPGLSIAATAEGPCFERLGAALPPEKAGEGVATRWIVEERARSLLGRQG